MIRQKDIDPCINYAIQIHYVKEAGAPGYFFAFHPEFGASSCSATGDTIPLAVMNLAKVRAEVMCFLQSTGRPIPKPTPHPFETATVNAQRCTLSCRHAGEYAEHYQTVKCKAVNNWTKIGAVCVNPTTHAIPTKDDKQWVCVHQCENATVLEYKNPSATYIKCGKDAHSRLPGVACPHPGSVRRLKGKLDRTTKHYLRAIRETSKKVPNQQMHDLAYEIAVTAMRLQRTTAPEYRRHYSIRDTLRYAIRVGALTLKLLTDHVEQRVNATQKDIVP